MNILKYDRWIFTTIHKQLHENYNRNIPTRTLRYIIGQMVIDGYLKESALIEIEESNNKNSSLLKEVTDKLAEYMMSNDYQSYSTNIRISQGTKDRLLDLKINPNESYEDVIIRLLS